jgi:Tfp pilus assembly protein PilZ
MSYQELRATLLHLKKIRVKADEIVHHPGDPEESLYFVISGELVKSQAKSESEDFAVVQFLIANDHFGDDHPCEVKEPVSYQIRAAGESELLKISKDDFLTICKDHPNLKNGLTKLVKDQLIPEAIKPEKFFRKTSRLHQTIYLSLDIFHPEPGRQPISVKGFSSDISLGGACVIVDHKYQDIQVEDILKRKIMLRVSLPDESISVLIMGNIVWSKKTEINGQQTCAIGLQFADTPPRLRAAMIVFVNAVGSMGKHAADYNLSQDEIERR